MKAFLIRATTYLGSMVERLRFQRSTFKQGRDPFPMDLPPLDLEAGCQEVRDLENIAPH